jgi:uncharacterized protein YoxC
MGGGLGSLFFKVVPDTNTKTPAPVQSQPVATPSMGRVGSMVGQEDQKIKEQLAKALDDANKPGFDYFEFAQALQAQESLIPAEAMRFQSVYMVAKSMGVTIDVLVRTANEYLDVLKKKETEFLTALQSHIGTDITGKEQSMSGIDKQIQDKSDQIRKLNEEMNTLQQQKVAMQNEVSTSKAEVEKIKNNFYATLQVFQGKITTDIQKINQYLK